MKLLVRPPIFQLNRLHFNIRDHAVLVRVRGLLESEIDISMKVLVYQLGGIL